MAPFLKRNYTEEQDQVVYQQHVHKTFHQSFFPILSFLCHDVLNCLFVTHKTHHKQLTKGFKKPAGIIPSLLKPHTCRATKAVHVLPSS